MRKERLFKDLPKEKIEFILLKINNYMIQIIDIIFMQLAEEDFDILAVEENITTSINSYKLNGKIDKVLKDKYDNYIVIDYKTGDPKLLLEDEQLNNGLNLQNLIYFILLKSKYESVNFAGTYRYKVQPLISREIEESKRFGYSSKNQSILNRLAIKNYKNLRLKKDGSPYVYSLTFTDEEYLNKIKIVEDKINEFVQHIQIDDVYDINPIKQGEILTCTYCPYKNICYKTTKDIRNI